MCVKLNALIWLYRFQNHPLFALYLLQRGLRLPLKRGKRLWYKRRNADGNVRRQLSFFLWHGIITFNHLFPQLHDPAQIVVRLSWKADHKVQLYRRIAGLKCIHHRIKQIFLCNAFVDDISQALCAGFRCKGQPCFPHLADSFCYLLSKRIDAQ